MPMPNRVDDSLPTLRHRRPTDATGCLWTVAVMAVWFGIIVFTKGSMEIFGFAFLFAVPVSITLFFERRRLDSKIIRSATDWCRENFPGLGKAPIVDFLVAIARTSEIDWESLQPTSPLAQFNVTQKLGQPTWAYAEQDFPKKWMEDLARDARIRLVANAEFCGTTLESALQFIVTSEQRPR